jgi:hypothetical protein
MTGGLATLPEEICKETIAEWNDATGDYVRGKMFAKIQFVTDTDLVTGGRIHALVTSELHINGEERKRQFWEDHGGRSTVRNTVRKKRQTAQNAMKLAFRGKLNAGTIFFCPCHFVANIICIVTSIADRLDC